MAKICRMFFLDNSRFSESDIHFFWQLIDKWFALLSVTVRAIIFLRKDQNIKQARLIREAFRKNGYFS